MGDVSWGVGHKPETSGAIELTGRIMITAVIVLCMVVVFVFALHVYLRWWFRGRQQGNNGPTRRRHRLDIAPLQQGLAGMTILRQGLEPSVLDSIPVVMFSSKEFKDGLECAVCLCEISEGEKARLLPKCNHGFHVDCIDMWFQSHSTCPICRNPISSQSSSNSNPESGMESILTVPVEENSPNFPTNVLFWGDETQVSTLGPLEEVSQAPNTQAPPPSSSSAPGTSSSSSGSSNRLEGRLVIDIPREINEEEVISKSPMPTRMASFKRLLSRDRRISPYSPRDCDLEDGTGVDR